jgi:DNA-binding response OmpR family regulator
MGVMRILVVEDELDIAQFLSQGLTEAGYVVDLVHDGIAAGEYCLAAEYSLILLDIMLPKLQLLRQIRSKSIQTPVLLLTARDAVTDRITGLDAGADDYLVKPFAFSELLARLRALLRRPPVQVDLVLQLGDVQMDIVQREVRCGSKSLLELSPREFNLLEYLIRHPARVLTRTQIAEHVWNFDFPGDFKVIDVYVGYLRRKLERVKSSLTIQTVRGVGYRAMALVRES